MAATVDYFLKIDGIEGESTDARHRGEITIDSWSVAEISGAASGSGAPGHGGGIAASRVTFQDFQFAAGISKASPRLFNVCVTGQRLPKAVLACRRAGHQNDFLTITLSNVLVTTHGMTGEDNTKEKFSLAYGAIEIQYVSERPDGSVAEMLKGGWDLVKGKIM